MDSLTEVIEKTFALLATFIASDYYIWSLVLGTIAVGLIWGQINHLTGNLPESEQRKTASSKR